MPDLPPTSTGRPLTGRPLRYFLTLVLADARRPMTVTELVAAVHAAGHHLAGRDSKAVSDALRWEIGKRRVVRRGRGRYATGTIPRTTAQWIRQQLPLLIR